MRYQDAVEIIKNEMECVKIADVNNCNRECAVCSLVMPTERIIEAYSTAINALEKQIPKKPIEISVPFVKWGKCPICKGELNALGGKPNHVLDGQMFCSDCGQALDWSDENDKTDMRPMRR